MLTTLAISNYRSIVDLKVSLGQLNVIIGENGSGKSNLYKALRLLAETSMGEGSVVNSLAEEGGITSTYWAGPEEITRAMKRGDVPIQGSPRKNVQRLKMGFASDELGYAIALGIPGKHPDADTLFSHDPEIKREVIFAGPHYRPSSSLVERSGPAAKVRKNTKWNVVNQNIPPFTSMFDQLADPGAAPEVFHVREMIRHWRFYDHFRTDKDAPARKPNVGTRTPILSSDGNDVAAALQTIIEIGDKTALDTAIDDAFPGSHLSIHNDENDLFTLQLYQPGLLRPLSGTELSDGTLRFILWIAALLTPRPPALMVLNEPETSLHPDLLPALARLILKAAEHSQVWVISHANRLVQSLEKSSKCQVIELIKEHGQTRIKDQDFLDEPAWHWPSDN